LKSKNKELERDLSDSVNELTKVREQFAECKEELETLRNTFSSLKEEKDSLELKKRDFESKVIVLQTDLESERKRNVANSGLEQTIAELHHQLDLKTTEIVDLTDQLESAKEDVQRYEDLLKEKEELIAQVQYLEKENLNFKEDIKKYSETLETQLSQIEQYKIRSADSAALIQSLETQLKSTNESHHKTVKSLESKVCELQTQLNSLEIEIKKKDEKFEEYKARVCKVLKQQNGSQNNLENSKQVENLESNIKNLNIDIKTLKYDQNIIKLKKHFYCNN
jgi:chromosome segregation ATPase